jgi:cell wall-associated NlpC family hydrolase
MKALLRTRTISTLLLGIALSALLLIGFAITNPSSAKAEPLNNSSQQVLQQQASELASQIQNDEALANAYGEQMDRDLASIQLLNLQLQALATQISATKLKVAQSKAELRSAAIAFYLISSPYEQLSDQLLSSLESANLQKTFLKVAASNFNNAVEQLKQAEDRLNQEITLKNNQINQIKLDEAQLQLKKTQALAAQSNAQTLLSKVKGQIAQLIIKQEQQAALQAAEAAQAAKNAQLKQESLKQAQQAASVLLSVTASTQSTTNTNTNKSEANQTTQNSTSQVVQVVSQLSQQINSYPTNLAGSDAEPLATSAQGLQALKAAESFLGTPYVWGGTTKGPTGGVDCSGLTMEAWAQAGISLLHSAYYQYLESTPISLSQLQPGDLLFYNFDGTGNPLGIDHVVMYVGSGPYGADTIIQASQPGTVVSFAPMYFVGFIGAGRP